MATTLLDLINEVHIATGQNTVSTITTSDDSAYLRDRINDALENLYTLRGTDIDTDGSVTLPASTRTVSPPSGLDVYRIYTWSFRVNDSNGDIPLKHVSSQFITEQYNDYESAEGTVPQYVYYDGGDLGFYPLLTSGASSLTVQFKYPAQYAKLTSTTDVIPFADRSEESSYVRYYAQMMYEVFKGLGQPGLSNDLAEDKWAAIVAKYRKSKRTVLTGQRWYA